MRSRTVLLTAMAVLLLGAPALAQVPIIPIAGDTPNVVLGLTDEDTFDDTIFTIVNSTSPSGSTLPLGGSPHYEIATYDTGASVHIISNEAFNAFNISGAGLAGSFTTGVGGGGGFVDALNNDPLGVYIAGVGAITSINPSLTVDTAQLQGQYNTSILSAQPGDVLPNVIGTPLSSQYTTLINYGDPQILTVDGATHRTPGVSLEALGSVPEPARRIGMTVFAGQLGDPPGFFPSFANLNDFHDDPATPTVGGSFFVDADITHDGNVRSNLEMILDTGAQGTIVSEQVAATLGFDVELDAPDFVVRIAGVTGTVDEVPGFIADQFELPGTGGGLTLTDVPLIVFDLTDPRDGVNTLPGLIGMNLFSDRNLVLNPEPGNAYLGISDPMLATHSWDAPGAGGTWATANNWSAAGVPAIDWVADVVNQPGVAQQAQVAADSTINHLQVRGDAATMDVVIQNGVTLTIFNTVILESGGSIVLENGTLDAAAVELRGGTIAGTGDVGGEVISQGTLAPGASAGTISFPGSFDQLEQGTMQIEIGGLTPGTQHDQVTVTGLVSLAGTLDLSLINGFTPGHGDMFTILTASDITGTFDTVLGADAGAVTFDVQYNAASVVLEAIINLLLGDANNDGQVTGADLIAVQQNFGSVGAADGTLLGDANDDGQVTGADLITVQQNFGNVLAPASASVPEPATAAVVTIGLISLLRARTLNVSDRRTRPIG